MVGFVALAGSASEPAGAFFFLNEPLGRPLLGLGGASWEVSLAKGDSKAMASCGEEAAAGAVPSCAVSVPSIATADLHVWFDD